MTDAAPGFSPSSDVEDRIGLGIRTGVGLRWENEPTLRPQRLGGLFAER